MKAQFGITFRQPYLELLDAVCEKHGDMERGAVGRLMLAQRVQCVGWGIYDKVMTRRIRMITGLPQNVIDELDIALGKIMLKHKIKFDGEVIDGNGTDGKLNYV